MSARVLVAAAIAWLVLFGIGTVVTRGPGTAGLVLTNVIYLGPHLLALALAIAAARRADGAYRRLWTMLACALPLWIAGEGVVSFHHVVLGNEPPFPGLADLFFLGFYVALIVTFLVALRPALSIRSWKAVLDASMLAMTAGFVGYIAVIEPQLSAPGSLATAVGIAYPVLGVVMVTMLISLTGASFRRPPASLLLLVAAIVAGALTDCVLAYVSINSATLELSWLKVGWEIEALLLAAAAIAAIRETNSPQPAKPVDLRDRGLAVAFAGVATTLVLVVVHTALTHFDLDVAIVAFAVLIVIALRLHMTSGEREQIAVALAASLQDQQRIANTDELTGLPNRRFADRHLKDRSVAGDDQTPVELGVLILDLDHFKQINDAHGHPVGDEVLRLTAARLHAACRPGDVVARYGGEEFLVILHEVTHDGLPVVAERFRARIAEEPFHAGAADPLIVTTSVGGASIPSDAATLTELIRIADRALYTAKAMGRNKVQIGAHSDEGTIDAMMERGTVLNFVQSLVDHADADSDDVGHGTETARWAGLVADELRVTSTVRWRTCAAARMQNIGMLRVAPGILATHGPLTERQWEDVRRHPDGGADILALAPGLQDIAEIVRQHHEHHDGAGYPRGLSGQDIAVEARIVSVCDAWVAMRSPRAHREALGAEAAIEELRRLRGRQFDPAAVDVLLAVIDRGELHAADAAALLAQ